MICPGRTLSGQWARNKSSPITNPSFSNIGLMTSSVDIGAIVDSMMTTFPFFKTGKIELHADMT